MINILHEKKSWRYSNEIENSFHLEKKLNNYDFRQMNLEEIPEKKISREYFSKRFLIKNNLSEMI